MASQTTASSMITVTVLAVFTVILDFTKSFIPAPFFFTSAYTANFLMTTQGSAIDSSGNLYATNYSNSQLLPANSSYSRDSQAINIHATVYSM